MQSIHNPSIPLMIWSLCMVIFAISCQKSITEPDEPPIIDKSSFELLQTKVFNTSCAIAGCHQSVLDATFAQHQLVLASDVAYTNLIGIVPTLVSAKADKLARVKAFSSDESLLFHKVTTEVAHHGGKTYGSLMPLGKSPLSIGQIEFIRRWIEAGAPKEGNVVDSRLLDDTTSSVKPHVFEPLAPPVAGTGFQLKTSEFEIPPNFEREIFVRRAIGNQTDIYVKGYQVKMRPNSHHFVANGFQTSNQLPALDQIRDLRNLDGSYNSATLLTMQNHVYNFASQTSEFTYNFPEGTALQLPVNASLDLNSHYVNKTDKSFIGEVFLNLLTVDQSQVKQVAKPIYMVYEKIQIPPRTRKTIVGSFTMKKEVQIVTLSSHTHKYGEKFVIKIKGGARNGEVVYTSTDWQHPESITYSAPFLLKVGEGLTSEVTYYNSSDKTVNFGLSSEDEMSIITGYMIEGK